jgi:L,D-peptidoglycan transpeptidase YkuD (ErfK/YbiS/YcfS/YnhG family)
VLGNKPFSRKRLRRAQLHPSFRPMPARPVRLIRVHPGAGDMRRGRLIAGPLSMPCGLGKGGVRADKREGDGATPLGRFPILGGFVRTDRWRRPRTRVPVQAIRPDHGWCDDPTDRRYNRPIRLPAKARHERMWREDGLYDLVLDLACNRGPIRRGRGSAIFLHLARPGFRPTEGCIAVAPEAARKLLGLLSRRPTVVIGPSARPKRRRQR